MSGIAIIINGADFSGSGNGKVSRMEQTIPITGIAIVGDSSVTNSSQFTAQLIPSNTTQTDVVWSIDSGSEFATIDQSGLLTALDADGDSVTIRCQSAVNPSVFATKTISVTGSTVSLVTDGLIRNFDAYGTESATLVDSVDGSIPASFNGVAGTNCVEITQNLDGNTHTGAAFERTLNGLSTWSLEYVLLATGWTNDANISRDIYHDVSSEDAFGRVVVYLGAISGHPNGCVIIRYNRTWYYRDFDVEVTSRIDWTLPHVINIVRENNVGNSDLFKLYVDGELLATAFGNTGYVGATYANDVVFLASKGQRSLHALRFYNRALTPIEVAQNYTYNVIRYGLNNSNSNKDNGR